jgi:hypothetical protein
VTGSAGRSEYRPGRVEDGSRSEREPLGLQSVSNIHNDEQKSLWLGVED